MKVATIKCPTCKKNLEIVPKYAYYLIEYAEMQSDGNEVAVACPDCEGVLPMDEIRKIAKGAK